MSTPARRDGTDQRLLELRLRALRDQIAPEANDQELALFAQVSAHLELDPFADQIVLIGRWDKRLGRKVHRHQVTVAGRRVIASRTGELVGIAGPEWCAPRAHADAPLVWLEVWDDDTTPPYCARVLVYRRGHVSPYNGTAKWSEFHQTDNQGKLLPLWRRMPSHMLGKVAESLALRRAFPDVLSGETVGAYVGPEAVDYAEVLEAAGGEAESVAPAWDIDTSADWPDPPDAVPDEVAEALEADAEAGNEARLGGSPLTGGLVTDRAWWVDQCERASVMPARLMFEARRLAPELGLESPRDGDDIRDPELVGRLLDWLDQVGPAE